jgi:subtilase family serine protease
VVLASGLLLIVAGAPQAGAAPRRTLADTAPRWVAKTQSLGRANGAKQQTVTVYLTPKGGLPALKADVAALADPKSSTYRNFLTPAQYHARYDATDVAVSEVSAWLKSSGIVVTGVEKNHRYVAARGTVANLQKTFGVTLHTYRHAGQTVTAPTAAATVPADVASYVSTVAGLDTTQRKMTHRAAPAPGFRNARPCSISYGQIDASTQADYKTPLPKFKGQTLPYAVCGYTGPRLRAAYENNSRLNGSGVTVAITDAYASPTIAKDANTYAKRHGDGAYTSGQLSQVKPSAFNGQAQCDPQGWYGEETLDIEAVHAMAPSAKIRYYASASCFDDDLLDTLSRVVEENQASVVSNSWGGPESSESGPEVIAYENVFLQGAMQGIGFMFASGDAGDELANTGIKQADYPTSDPYVTAVGGTSDAIGAHDKFNFQTGWGTHKYNLSADGKSWISAGFLYGAGGGSSALFNRPDYQNGVVPGRFGSGRAVPDVGLDADPNTGFLIGQTQTFSDGVYYDEYRIGGTSLASPLYAGMTALASQHAGGRLGFLNPTIYSQAGTNVFTDIKGQPSDPGNVRVDFANSENAKNGLVYSVRTFNQDSSLQVGAGWDNVTGVGSPNDRWLTSIDGT